jgi:hypothetical protein
MTYVREQLRERPGKVYELGQPTDGRLAGPADGQSADGFLIIRRASAG